MATNDELVCWRDCEERSVFESLVADLSLRFINLQANEVDDQIMDALSRVGELLGLDLLALWQWTDALSGTFALTHLYSTQDGPLPTAVMDEDYFPWCRQEIAAGRIVQLDSMEKLPPEAARDRESAGQFGIKSSLCLPLSAGGEPPVGILGLNTTRAERDWPDALVKRLQLVAQIFTNALARKRAELETAELRRELTHMARVSTLGELAASLAHELNQPLAAILSNAQAARQFLAAPDADLDEIRAILDDIVKDDKRAGEVIHRLRALVDKKQAVEASPLDVNELVLEAERLLNSELMSRGVDLELRLPPSLPATLAGRVEVQQVMLNLMVNAMDAMRDQPAESRKIVVETSAVNGSVRVAVRDSGHGIPDAVMPDIFRPFFTTKEHGLGMGLAVCRSMIESYGGKLWAENAPDGGAVFQFELPQAVDGDPSANRR